MNQRNASKKFHISRASFSLFNLAFFFFAKYQYRHMLTRTHSHPYEYMCLAIDEYIMYHLKNSAG